jgi:Tfp pilus assembly protein PilF
MMLSKIRLFVIVLTAVIVGAVGGFLVAPKYAATAGGAASEAMVALAGQALEQSDLQKAESLAFDAIASDPDSYVPYVVLGEVFTRRGDTSAARSAYSRALEKLEGPGGNFQVLKLDEQLRDGERRVLHEKLERLPKT